MGTDWKRIQSADITPLLREGTNVISARVTNSKGPPALWLCLEAGSERLGSDTNWTASLAGSDWQPSRLTDVIPNDLLRRNLTLDVNVDSASLQTWIHSLVVFLICFAACCTILIIPGRLTKRRLGVQEEPRAYWEFWVLIGILIVRLAFFLNDAPQLPPTIGFDAAAHEEYVQFLIEQGRLPLPQEGWEMFQPPLYYGICALVVKCAGTPHTGPDLSLILRSVNAGVGLAQCVIALLCFRYLLPGQRAAQIAALAVVAFLPPDLCLSQYVTNECLSGLFVTLALYFYLRQSNITRTTMFGTVAVGICLGAALLTKASALLSVPIFALVMFQASNETVYTRFRKRLAPLTLSLVAICGWYYAWIWVRCGKPIVGNWETGWWQDPGYRTAGFFSSFGTSLSSPLFSALNSFWDGLYSTIWSDGLMSGAARLMPWNYEWLTPASLFGFLLTCAFVWGLVGTVVRAIKSHSSESFLLLAMLGAYGLAVLFMTLQVPAYAQVKAFYALPALVPFCTMIARGWNSFHNLGRRPAILGWAVLCSWAATVSGAFWIHASNPATPLTWGLYRNEKQEDGLAARALADSLRLSSNQVWATASGVNALRAEAFLGLGSVTDRQGQPETAIAHYRLALRCDPTSHAAMNNLAWLLATTSAPRLRAGDEAVELASQACRITHHEITMYVGTLAAAYAEAGRFAEAIVASQKAIALAELRHETELAQRNRELLELYKTNKAYHEGAETPKNRPG